MSRTAPWELAGFFLAAGSSLFALFYASPPLQTLEPVFRGGIGFSPNGEAALGLATLALAGFASFTGMLLALLKPPAGEVGVIVIVWTEVLVLVAGDAVWYFTGVHAPTVLLVGLVAGVLAFLALLGVSGRVSKGSAIR